MTQATFLHPTQIRKFTKIFAKDVENPNAGYNTKRFTSTVQTFETLSELYDIYLAQADAGNCALVGSLTQPLNDESRSGHISDADTSIGIIDADGISIPPGELIDIVNEFDDVSYILHWSTSHGVVTREDGVPIKQGYSYHIILLFSRPIPVGRWKLFLLWLNLEYFKDDIRTNKFCTGLILPIDLNMGMPSQILTIAPPVCDGEKYEDTLTNRWELHERDKPTLQIQSFPTISGKDLFKKKKEILNELRLHKGLDPIVKETVNFSPKVKIQVANNPKPSRLTFLDESNGHAHYNLGDGDSGAYWHPINTPEIVYSFKPDEAPYDHKQIDEASYTEACKRANIFITTADEKQHKIIFCREENKYYGLEINNSRQHVEINDVSSAHIAAYADTVDMLPPSHFDNFSFRFDPSDPRIMDLENETVNKFQEPDITLGLRRTDDPEYTIETICPTVAEKCPHIWHLMLTSNGDNMEATKYELNWFALLAAYRQKPTTSIVKSGTPGTGKNLLVKRVYAPILGDQYVSEITKKIVMSDFNSEMETARLLHMDETNVGSQDLEFLNSLKAIQTANSLRINRKYAQPHSAKVHFGMMFFANTHGFLTIEPGDRRFWVSPRQENRLTHINGVSITDDHGQKIDDLLNSELRTFAEILYNYEVDMQYMINTEVLDTPAKRALQIEAKSHVDMFIDAIQQGNLDFFINNTRTIIQTMEGPEAGHSIMLARVILRYLPFLNQTINIDMMDMYYAWMAIANVRNTNYNKFKSMLQFKGVATQAKLPCPADNNQIHEDTLQVCWHMSPELSHILIGTGITDADGLLKKMIKEVPPQYITK